jgi:hypothetical protein
MSIRYAGWPMSLERRPGLAGVLYCFLLLGCSDDSHRLGGEPLTCKSGAEFESVDDMEDGDGTIALLERRGGVWFSFNDRTGGEQEPLATEETFPMAKLAPPRAGSRYAAHTKGQGFETWGAGIGFELYNQQAYDLSSYAGISFWARRAPGTTASLRFDVPDSATTERGGQCSPCNNHFGVYLELDTSFQLYRYEWHELKQRGNERVSPMPPSMNAAMAYGLRFQTGQNEDFEYWIDDIALLCRTD